MLSRCFFFIIFVWVSGLCLRTESHLFLFPYKQIEKVPMDVRSALSGKNNDTFGKKEWSQQVENMQVQNGTVLAVIFPCQHATSVANVLWKMSLIGIKCDRLRIVVP